MTEFTITNTITNSLPLFVLEVNRNDKFPELATHNHEHNHEQRSTRWDIAMWMLQVDMILGY